MDTKHTPGPWTVLTPKDQEEDAYIVAEKHCIIVCNSPTKTLAPSQAAWPYNARLIAAAPEMLEALEKLYEDVDCVHATGYWSESFVDTKRKIRAAIDKATGQ